ncbi:MAG: polymer-forming cytoskeletal protein [Firmicutes bacterium]|nr:polymer-forming cytoskeletal protein [Bacillota bacterium]
MAKKALKTKFENVETLIAADIVIKGNLSTEKSLRIDGKLIGGIDKALGVIVGESAVIEGNITADAVLVGGTIKGNITAADGIEILPNAKVIGDIKTNILSIGEGAVFEGASSMITGSHKPSDKQQEVIKFK